MIPADWPAQAVAPRRRRVRAAHARHGWRSEVAFEPSSRIGSLSDQLQATEGTTGIATRPARIELSRSVRASSAQGYPRDPGTPVQQDSLGELAELWARSGGTPATHLPRRSERLWEIELPGCLPLPWAMAYRKPCANAGGSRASVASRRETHLTSSSKFALAPGMHGGDQCREGSPGQEPRSVCRLRPQRRRRVPRTMGVSGCMTKRICGRSVSQAVNVAAMGKRS